MKTSWWKDGLLVGVSAFCLACVGVIAFGLLALARTPAPQRTDRALSEREDEPIQAAAALLRQRRLTSEAALVVQIERRGQWRAATPDDPYLKQAEQSGDTPFAYTLADGHHPTAIVLAPRFFADTTPTARAALMIHELAHYRAYVKSGRSDEFDGYKAEYDTHDTLGLGEGDGLTYFALLDGVVEYVAPRLPAYKKRPDIKGYMESNNG